MSNKTILFFVILLGVFCFCFASRAGAQVPVVSPSMIDFGNQPLGGTAAVQTVTLSNQGTVAFTVNSLATAPPFSIVSTSRPVPVQLSAGKSLFVQINFFAGNLGPITGTLTFSLAKLPAVGASLSGTGVAATSLGIANFPVLPSATQSAAYLATLLAADGVGPFVWNLTSGSTLPAGLTLSSSGTISGTLDPSVAVANYSFNVQVVDSNANASTAQLTLPVGALTGASCNNITFNIPGTSSPIIPLNDLGANTYLGVQGGLYPNGSNVRPPSHDAAGVSLANSIQPLSANGNPDPNGVYVLLGIGASITQKELRQFLPIANADPSKNPKLVIVNGATPGETATAMRDPNNSFWGKIINTYLPSAGVTANQVTVMWIETYEQVTGFFPADTTGYKSDVETIVQNLHNKFPNLKITYVESRNYAGYWPGLTVGNPEPYAYESGFVMKFVIEDQINGNPNLNFDPTKGPVMAPWLSWGAYYWANGLLTRNDGLVWSCQDLGPDGIHESLTGAVKMANIMLNFFKTDNTAMPWFLAH